MAKTHTPTPKHSRSHFADDRLGEKSEEVRGRVKTAHSRQLERFQCSKLTYNAKMTPTEVGEFCQVEESAQSLLKMAMEQIYLSAHAFHRILKLPRTIADLKDPYTSRPTTWLKPYITD